MIFNFRIVFSAVVFFIYLMPKIHAQACRDQAKLYENIPDLKARYQSKDAVIKRIDTVLTQVKVVRIKDGDTAEILVGDFYLDVRFDHIDAPEISGSQPFSKASRKQAIQLLEGKEAYLLTQRVSKGGFGRFLGVFYTTDGLNVNKSLLANGLAWHYSKYSKDKDYEALEQCARKHKLGLWKDKRPIAPWNWRKGKR